MASPELELYTPAQKERAEEYATAIRLYQEDREAYFAYLPIELRMWVEDDPPPFIVLRHPFMYVRTPEPPRILVERYWAKADYIKKAIEAGNVGQALAMYEKPFRLVALDWIWNRQGWSDHPLGMGEPVYHKPFSIDDYREALGGAWTDTEMPSQARLTTLLPLFERAGWVTDVLDEEGNPSPRPDMTLTLYRGVQVKRRIKGLSWTTNPAKAEWFAKRWMKQKAYVAEAQVEPWRLLARFEGRGEAEYVINPSKLDYIVHEVTNANQS